MAQTTHYSAFLSYSHKDAAWADWLRDALETYRIPELLRGQLPDDATDRLGPVFQDREELPAHENLSVAIVDALRSSRSLVVLCSPDSARSRYVDKEIRTFKAMVPERSIFSVIVAGEPGGCDAANGIAAECFPSALRSPGIDAEPVAPDLRPGKDGKHKAKLKLIAGIMGIGLATLVRRDHEQEAVRLAELALDEALEGDPQLGVQIALRGFQHLQLDAHSPSTERLGAALFASLKFLLRARVFRGHRGAVVHVAFSPRDPYLATSSLDGTVKLWRLDSQDSIEVEERHGRSVSRSLFAEDGRALVTCGGDSVVHVWDFDPSHRRVALRHKLKPSAAPILHAAVSPDGDDLLVCTADSHAHVFSVRSGLLKLTLRGHRGSVRFGAFSRDGSLVITASSDRTARVWITKNGKALFELAGHDGEVVGAAFSANGTSEFADSIAPFTPRGIIVATAAADRCARLWRLRIDEENNVRAWLSLRIPRLVRPPGATCLRTLESHSGAVSGVFFLPHDTEGIPDLITAGADDSVRWWSGERSGAIAIRKAHPPDRTMGPTAAQLFAGISQGPPTPAEEPSDRDPITTVGSTLCAVHPYGWGVALASHRVATLFRDTRFAWGDRRDCAILEGHSAAIKCVSFSSDGRLLATSGEGDSAVVWFCRPGRDMFREIRLRGRASGIAFVQGGDRLLVDFGASAALIDASSGETCIDLHAPGTEKFCEFAFSGDGTRLAAACSDGSARIWSLSTGKEEKLVTQNEMRTIVYPGFFREWLDDEDGGKMKKSLRAVWPALGEWIEQMWNDACKSDHLLMFSPVPKALLDNVPAEVTPAILNALLYAEHRESFLHLAFDALDEHLLTFDFTHGCRSWSLRKWHEVPATFRIAAGTRSVEAQPSGEDYASSAYETSQAIAFVGSCPERLLTNLEHAYLPRDAEAEEAREETLLAVDGSLVVTLHRRSAASVGVLGAEVEATSSASAMPIVRAWDTRTGSKLSEFEIPGDKPHLRVVHGRAARLITTVANAEADLWDLHHGTHVGRFVGHLDPCGFQLDCVFSSDGARILTKGSQDPVVRLWGATTGELLAELHHPWEVSEAVLNADGSRVATTDKSVIWLWNVLPGGSRLLEYARSLALPELTEEQMRALELD